MDPTQASDFERLLAHLMETVRSNPSLTSEVHRAEREFFQANPAALEKDPSAPARFREWFLLERESDVLGGVPSALLPMSDEQRQSLEDSLVGVFQIQGIHTDEYLVTDLQEEHTRDVACVEGVELATGDLLIGRLFEGPLDVYVASASMAFQRDARALAAAFSKDIRAMDLGRRLTQAELEHLMFRGRSQPEAEEPDAIPAGVPLEHLEADLEKCLNQGGVTPELLSATSISASLGGIPRPGLILDPLLEKLAFDSEVDLEEARRILLQIWERRQVEDQRVPPLGESADADDPADSEDRPWSEEPAQPAVPEASQNVDNEPAPPPSTEPDTAPSGLGASVRAEIEAGLAEGKDLEQVFAQADEMVGGTQADDQEDRIQVDGNLRALIAEYLWESEAHKSSDTEVLEQLVRIQCEAPVPHMDLEEVSLSDVLRLMMQTYLAGTPGQRTAQVGATFAALKRFFEWGIATQGFPLQVLIDGLQEGFVDNVARLEAASLALSGGAGPEETARDLYRVVSVASDRLEIVAEEGDRLLQVAAPPACADHLRAEDLLLAAVQSSGEKQAALVGMVIAMPPVARNLLG